MESEHLEFKSWPKHETNLVGYIKLSSEAKDCVRAKQDFLIELESVMTKYKVVLINASFDAFKMQQAKVNDT